MNNAASPVALRIEELVAGYGSRTVLAGVTLTLNERECLAIIGQNGSGKSTLLKVLGGLLPVRSGGVAIKGSATSVSSPHKLLSAGISYFPQGGLIVPTLTVEEHLALVARQSGRGDVQEQVYQLFPLLRQLAMRRAGSLSGGERQILSFGILTMQGTRTWLLDEPTAGLSPQMIEFTIEFLQKKKGEGISMLMVEHNMDVAYALADTIVVAKEGSLSRKFRREEFQGHDFISQYVYNQAS